jgi:hypothetical protein
VGNAAVQETPPQRGRRGHAIIIIVTITFVIIVVIISGSGRYASCMRQA